MEGGGQDLPSCIAGITLPSHAPHGRHRHIEVPLAHVPALVDGVKYMEPRDVPRLKGSELRRRAPSLRFLVKLAVRCQSAQELGKELRRRYQRQQQRQGIETSRTAAAAAS
jgi:hypothetical protein